MYINLHCHLCSEPLKQINKWYRNSTLMESLLYGKQVVCVIIAKGSCCSHTIRIDSFAKRNNDTIMKSWFISGKVN